MGDEAFIEFEELPLHGNESHRTPLRIRRDQIVAYGVQAGGSYCWIRTNYGDIHVVSETYQALAEAIEKPEWQS